MEQIGGRSRLFNGCLSLFYKFHFNFFIIFNSNSCLVFSGSAVGIYTTNSPEACFFVANDCNANIMVVENKTQLDKILKVMRDQIYRMIF